MAPVNQSEDMSLSPDRLSDLDEWILDFLQEHEWATPNLIQAYYCDHLADDDSSERDSVSRQHISNRLRRLYDTEHVEQVHDDAYEYRLVDDPRDSDGNG